MTVNKTPESTSIMVVDDTSANLKLLQEMLRAKGYLVLTFLRGAMALNAAATNRIEQVINNLLSNAIKYSQPGTDITVRLLHENNEVIIPVADQGPGILEKEQHKLFQAFGKTSVQPTSEKERSTGLGLLIVRKIIEAHEGRLWLLSEPGKGTEFFFSLPVMP